MAGDEAKRSKRSSQLGEDAQAIISSINTTIAHTAQALQTQIGSVSADVKSLEQHVKSTTQRVDQHDLRFEALESEVKALRDLVESGMGQRSGTVVGTSGGSSDARTAPPLHKRHSVVVGGFERDTDKKVIDARLKDITKDVKDTVVECFSFGKLSSCGVIIFKSSGGMWEFLKKYKGTRFNHNGRELWHSIEKTKLERELAKRVSKAVRVVRSHLQEASGLSEEDAKKRVDADWVKGLVFTRQGDAAVRIYEKDSINNVLTVAASAKDGAPDLDAAAELASINACD